MRRLLTVVVALGIVFSITPAWAGSGFLFQIIPSMHPPTGAVLGFTWEPFVQWQGCHAGISVLETPQFNATYSVGLNRIFVYQGLLDYLAPSPQALAFVIAHEVGHCLQMQGQSPWLSPDRDYADIYVWERDAEAHAVKILRVLGYDGRGIGLKLRLDRAKTLGRDPRVFSPTHGSVYSITEWARDHDGLGKLREPYGI